MSFLTDFWREISPFCFGEWNELSAVVSDVWALGDKNSCCDHVRAKGI